MKPQKRCKSRPSVAPVQRGECGANTAKGVSQDHEVEGRAEDSVCHLQGQDSELAFQPGPHSVEALLGRIRRAETNTCDAQHGLYGQV